MEFRLYMLFGVWLCIFHFSADVYICAGHICFYILQFILRLGSETVQRFGDAEMFISKILCGEIYIPVFSDAETLFSDVLQDVWFINFEICDFISGVLGVLVV